MVTCCLMVANMLLNVLFCAEILLDVPSDFRCLIK